MTTSYGHVEEYEFKQKLDTALRTVKRVLHVDQEPRLASQVHHKYEDKFALAEYLVNVALASQLHCLSRLGLTPSLLHQLKEWVATRAVSLEFSADEYCTFDREETEDIESKTKSVTEVKVDGEAKATIESKTVTTVTTYFWTWESRYSLVAYAGVGDEVKAVLQQGTISRVLTTSSKDTPRPEIKLSGISKTLNITFMLRYIDAANLAPAFRIARGGKNCMTPRRNTDIEAAMKFFAEYIDWAFESNSIPSYLRQWDDGVPHENACRVFVPVWPLMAPAKDDPKVVDLEDAGELEEPVLLEATPAEEPDERPAEDAGEQAALAAQLTENAGRLTSQRFTSVLGEDGAFTREELYLVISHLNALGSQELDTVIHVLFANVPAGGRVGVQRVIEHFFPDTSYRLLAAQDTNGLLAEERRTLAERCTDLAVSNGKNENSVRLAAVLHHGHAVARQLLDALEFLELMIRQQLIAAIGKVVVPADFAEYMRFHNRKIFQESFLPRPFSYAVRRSSTHAPEGVVSVEAKGTKGLTEPIMTVVNSTSMGHLMRFPLGASVKVPFRGERHVHAACLHQFSSETGAEFHLEARAHQFSSMIVLIGRIASATEFQPKYAAIIKNKDDLTVPLELNTIPAPKEFRDAIASLSPEQQAFAQAYRAMQLESTLFGVLVIQIKPQMERLLGLPEGALSQEIKLTQDLMELFITYQIPSDLLIYTGDLAAPPAAKVEAVRNNVAAMHNVFKDGIRAEVEEAIMKGKLELELEQEKSRERIQEEQQRCIREIENTQRRCNEQIESTKRRCRNEEASLNASVESTRRQTRKRIAQLEEETQRNLRKMQAEAEVQKAQMRITIEAEKAKIVEAEEAKKADEAKKRFEQEEARLKAISTDSPEAEAEKAKNLEENALQHAMTMQRLEVEKQQRMAFLEILRCEVMKAQAEVQCIEKEEEMRRYAELECERGMAEACSYECAKGMAVAPDYYMEEARCMAFAEEAAMLECCAMECTGLACAPEPPRAMAARSRAAAPRKGAEKAAPEGGDPKQAQNASVAESPVEIVDYTQIPRELDRRFEQLDEGGCLRPTIINPGEVWTKRAQEHLLAKPKTIHLGPEDLKSEKDKAFDLLSALSCSGALTIDHATLHVMVAATHCFDKSVIDTVVQDNVNPIEKAERSTLIMATTIHKRSTGELLQQSQLPRIQNASPMLFN